MLLTRGQKLSSKLIKYIESADNVIIYKLDNHHIPSNIFFPNAKQATIINCSKFGVFNILTPYIFPNVHKINYLSANPGNFDIYKRFNNIEWVFPEKNYPFYSHLIDKQIGTRDAGLINRYLANKRVIDGNNGFDISFHFDILLPEYGQVNGEWYRTQFYEYCVAKQNEMIDDSDNSYNTDNNV